ncbi:FxSxx-COOH protein [Streptomyces sp. NBC_00285]|uniref:FxSxx-COOH cyclophane-containing RiPP peptide n=1 Tax=Streptomyces sp. NBC_00285 TaxID=2975700 RepID=UPI002E2A687F|nr:FxSxx-COOH cyclophane-containing RiPP peptide [Streptomyces sp. NBC_00285]
MNTPTTTSADEPGKQSTAGERVPLVRLAARADGLRSGALTRVVPQDTPDRGPARVSVAAFQSAV